NKGWCFQVIKLENTLNVLEHEVLPNNQTLIEIISPQPATAHQTIQIQLSNAVLGKYEISLYSQIGSKIVTMQSGELLESKSIINLPLSDFNLSKGVYWLSLKVGKETANTKLIIN
ncbi:MAG: T9SS type A sorting domain-containing protein, partial [Bacteroidetes bacterium]|nr:T9SS type A sorting domain-containing protein [Bacteroidota bacterium]